MIILILSSSFIFIFAAMIAFGFMNQLSKIPKSQVYKSDKAMNESAISRYLFDTFIELKFLLKPLADINKKLKLTSYRLGLENRLRTSGLGTNISQDEFMALKQLAAMISFISFARCAFVVFHAFHGSNLILCLLPATLAFFFPDFWLHEIIANRRRNIMTALPGMIDLLILCVESGIDFVSAVDRIVKESKSGALNDELRELISEIRVGRSRRAALINLAYRTGIADINSFVAALSQADALGSGLVPILRIQADQLRNKRAQRAEKMATEAPVKMLFPILLFIFPVVFIMLLAPIIIKSIQSIKPF